MPAARGLFHARIMAQTEPQTVDLTVYQGEPFTAQLVFKDSAGALQDVTGYSAKLQARDQVPSQDVRIDWSSAAGDMVLGTTDGTLTFAVTAAAVNALTTDNRLHSWVYDLFLTSSDGTPRKACKGNIVLTPRITRA
jgi:hypothetical protein